jgi:hypothetical protein
VGNKTIASEGARMFGSAMGTSPTSWLNGNAEDDDEGDHIGVRVVTTGWLK